MLGEFGEVKVRFEELEVRTARDYPEPFPLYPYEEIHKDLTEFYILKDSDALVLRAVRPFKDDRFDNKERFVGDEYFFKGPGTYIPRIEEEVSSKREAFLVLPNNGIVLKARRDVDDVEGKHRKAGETVRSNYSL